MTTSAEHVTTESTHTFSAAHLHCTTNHFKLRSRILTAPTIHSSLTHHNCWQIMASSGQLHKSQRPPTGLGGVNQSSSLSHFLPPLLKSESSRLQQHLFYLSCWMRPTTRSLNPPTEIWPERARWSNWGLNVERPKKSAAAALGFTTVNSELARTG